MRLRISIRGRVSPSIRPSACFSIRPSVCPSVCMSRIYFEGQFWMFLSATSHQMASQLLKKMTDASDVPPRYLFSWGLFRHRAYLKISWFTIFSDARCDKENISSRPSDYFEMSSCSLWCVLEYLNVSLSVRPSIHLSICLHVCPSVRSLAHQQNRLELQFQSARCIVLPTRVFF